MTGDICYKTNHLVSVIARVDFQSPISELEKQLPPQISKGLMSDFPIADSRRHISQKVQISPDEVTQERSEHTEWRFHGRNRSKTFTILPSAVFVEYTSYESYERLKKEFLSGLELFFKTFDEDAVGRRLGLRYINNIRLKNGEPLSWEDYLNSSMLCVFQLYSQPRLIARVFHNLELNFGDFNLRYQFGMHNPDYPTPIMQKSFILDLDAYSEGPLDFSDIAGSLDAFHDQIQELFELSIRDGLREVFNG